MSVGCVVEETQKKGKLSHKQFFRRYTGYCDSKIVDEEARERLYEKICASQLVFAHAFSSAQEIDRHRIVRALRTAICRMVRQLLQAGALGPVQKIPAHYSLTALKQMLSVIPVTLVLDGNSDF